MIMDGGTRWLPDELHVTLELTDVRQFARGFFYLHYRLAP